MKKHELTKYEQTPDDVKEPFIMHCKMVGGIKPRELMYHLVIKNRMFPPNEDIEAVCTDFFQAMHSGMIDRKDDSIEAHTRAFGQWIGGYIRKVELKRAGELLYTLPKHEPIHDTPKASEPVTRQNWNLMRGIGIDEIKRNIAIMDSINQAPDENRKNRTIVKGVSGVDNFMARCRQSLRRYQIAFGVNE